MRNEDDRLSAAERELSALLDRAAELICAGDYARGEALLDYDLSRNLYRSEGMRDSVNCLRYDALLGKLCLERGDAGSAAYLWFGNFVSGCPSLYYVFLYGFGDEALALGAGAHGAAARELANVRRLFDGRRTLRRYLKRGRYSAETLGVWLPPDGDLVRRRDPEGFWYWSAA